MKKILLFVVCCFIGIINVFAEEYDTKTRGEFIDNVYSNYTIDGKYYSGHEAIIYVNGLVGYCLDPLANFNTNQYNSSTDFSLINISDEMLYYLEIVNHFGYGYDGREDKMYYLATQEIIWEYLYETDVYWTDGENGEIINIDKYKTEILTSVNHYLQTPDIPTYLETYQYQNIVLEDKNDVLNYYQSNLSLGTIEGNKLTLNAQSRGTKTITLKQKKLNNNFSYIYTSGTSQILGTFGFSNNQNNNIIIKYKVINMVKITLAPMDLLYNKVIKNRQTKVKIFDISRNQYIEENNNDIFTIGSTGLHTTELYLPEGEYRIEYVESPGGYRNINQSQIFNIYEYDNSPKSIPIYYQSFNYTIKIHNNGELFSGIETINNNEIKGTYITTQMNNVKYGIYAKEDITDLYGSILYKKDTLVSEINIENGIGTQSELNYGEYYIKALSYPDEYYFEDLIIEVSLKSNQDIVLLDVFNYMKKGNIIIKTTSDSEVIPGTQILFSGIKYIEENLLESNNNGLILVKSVPYDDYNLQEIKVPNGYILDTDKKYFTLNTINYDHEIINEKEEPKEENIPSLEEIEKEEEIETKPEDNLVEKEESKEENIPSVEEVEKEEEIETKPEDNLVEKEEPKEENIPSLEEVEKEEETETNPEDNLVEKEESKEENIPSLEEIEKEEESKEEVLEENSNKYEETVVQNPDTFVNKYNSNMLNIIIYAIILFESYKLKTNF